MYKLPLSKSDIGLSSVKKEILAKVYRFQLQVL